MEIIKIVIFTACILTVFYSIFKKNRILFNYGYLITGLVIVLDQAVIFYDTSSTENLALICLWIIQIVLVMPNRLPPLTKAGSVVAKSAIPKIMISLSIINFFGAYYSHQVNYIPDFAMYGHIILALIPIFPAYYILADKIEIIDN
tara:strand:+ start:2526 stop:2963 length:438 start_codon:yes stop_codon:yes gene_type:complete